MKKSFMSKRILSLLIVLSLCLTLILPSSVAGAGSYSLTLDKTEYLVGESVTITFAGCTDTNAWVGITLDSYDHYEGNNMDVWAYCSSGTRVAAAEVVESGSFSITSNKLVVGDYRAYLMSDEGYNEVATFDFSVVDAPTVTPDPNAPEVDVSPASVTYDITGAQGLAVGSVTITPPEDSTNVTGYNVYWADANGKLAGYTPLGYTMHSTVAEIKLTIDVPTIIPVGATHLRVYTVVSGAESEYFTAVELDSSKLMSAATPLYSFTIFTDIHINNESASHLHNQHFTAALNDVLNVNPDALAIFTVGDNTDNGYEAQWKHLISMRDSILGNRLPMYFSIGNHDYASGDINASIDLFSKYTSQDKVYSKVVINGAVFLILGCDQTPSHPNNASLSDEQLTWLENELAEASKNTQPIFVFLHQPLQETTSGTLTSVDPDIQDWHGVDENSKLQGILNKYPSVIMVTGHTHWHLESLQPILPGNGGAANYVNAASVGYLWDDNDQTYPGSQYLQVEVYQDYVLLRGRSVEDNLWISAAQFKLDVATDPTTVDPNNSTPTKAPTTIDDTDDSDDETSNVNRTALYIALAIGGVLIAAIVVVVVVVSSKKKK